MLGDRIFDRANCKELIVLDGTAKSFPRLRQMNRNKHLATVFKAGKNFYRFSFWQRIFSCSHHRFNNPAYVYMMPPFFVNNIDYFE